jgi:hypothetical protein
MNKLLRRDTMAIAHVALLLTGFSTSVLANPEITRVEGVIQHGNEIQIHGLSFGVKSPARPYFWAPMENSSEPSPLGSITNWSYIGGMAYAEGEGPKGGGALKAVDASGTWTAQVNTPDLNWAAPGQKMYLYRKLKHNFSIFEPVAINWKSWRVWGELLQDGRTISAMDGIWNGSLSMTSGYSVESGQSLYPLNSRCGFGLVNEWNTNEILLRVNTNAVGFGDGYFQYKTNGANCGEVPYRAWEGIRHLKMWDANHTPNLTRNFIVHGVKANHEMGPNDRYWATSVYLDTTWARVMVANAPSLNQATHLEIQIPLEWSDRRITVQANTGAFPNDQPAYLFVVDSLNNASPGYPLTRAAPSPPEDVHAQ